eukprot:5123754-Pyramimonas_sp.AAC.1
MSGLGGRELLGVVWPVLGTSSFSVCSGRAPAVGSVSHPVGSTSLPAHANGAWPPSGTWHNRPPFVSRRYSPCIKADKLELEVVTRLSCRQTVKGLHQLMIEVIMD